MLSSPATEGDAAALEPKVVRTTGTEHSCRVHSVPVRSGLPAFGPHAHVCLQASLLLECCWDNEVTGSNVNDKVYVICHIALTTKQCAGFTETFRIKA